MILWRMYKFKVRGVAGPVRHAYLSSDKEEKRSWIQTPSSHILLNPNHNRQDLGNKLANLLSLYHSVKAEVTYSSYPLLSRSPTTFIFLPNPPHGIIYPYQVLRPCSCTHVSMEADDCDTFHNNQILAYLFPPHVHILPHPTSPRITCFLLSFKIFLSMTWEIVFNCPLKTCSKYAE